MVAYGPDRARVASLSTKTVMTLEPMDGRLAYRPRWSNCLFWTAHQLHHHGGYGLIRRGHNGVPFHVLWSPDHVSVFSYEPLKPHWMLGDWRTDLLLLFKGRIVEGDEGDWPLPQQKVT